MTTRKNPNPHVGGDVLADVQKRVRADPRLRARIEASVARVSIGALVKRGRTVAGLTQSQLASRAGTTQAVIAKVEGGKAFTASIELLGRIASALGGRLTVEIEGIPRQAA